MDAFVRRLHRVTSEGSVRTKTNGKRKRAAASTKGKNVNARRKISSELVRDMRGVVGKSCPEMDLRSCLFRANCNLQKAISIYYAEKENKNRQVAEPKTLGTGGRGVTHEQQKTSRTKSVESPKECRDDDIATRFSPRECTICGERRANHAFLPCGHLCACAECLKKREGTQARHPEESGKCPLCGAKGVAQRIYAP